MAYPWTVYKTWTTGEILTAADLNSSFTQGISNSIPTSIDDYSSNTAQMQSTADPYPAGVESLASTIAGELERLRYVIAQITGETQWYIDPDVTLANVMSGTTAFAGAKTFSSLLTASAGVSTTAVTATATTNQLLLGTTNTVTISASAPSASRVYTIADAGAAASFVMTEGTQTINGTKTFAGQLIGKGTTTNDSPSAGYIGEVVESVATANFPTSQQFGDLTSLSLTAGDWLVSAVLSGTVENNSSKYYELGISTTSGNDATGLVQGSNRVTANPVYDATEATQQVPLVIPNYHVQLSGTTTYYMKYRHRYTGSASTARGRITAVRIR